MKALAGIREIGRGVRVGLFAAAVSATLAVSLLPSVPDPGVAIHDKWAHAVVYAGNAVLAAWAFPSARGLAAALFALITLGAGLEAIQGSMVGRDGSWLDAGANALGLGIGGLVWARRLRGRAGNTE